MTLKLPPPIKKYRESDKLKEIQKDSRYTWVNGSLIRSGEDQTGRQSLIKHYSWTTENPKRTTVQVDYGTAKGDERGYV